MDKIDEWSIQKRWNPFNSYKLMAQVYRWSMIKRGEAIPQPALVTVDPINSCNFNCSWCNSARVKNRGGAISKQTLVRLADVLGEWHGSPHWSKGVGAVCIAGGGEPLLNKDIGVFIEHCYKRGIEIGVVTNGYYIDRFIEPLSLCTFVGVSLDAGSEITFNNLKGLPNTSGALRKILSNIEKLVEFSKKQKNRLGNDSPGYGVSYKFLLCNQNVNEVYQSVRLAKEIGCKNFHLRPVGATWFDLSLDRNFIDEDLPQKLTEELERARKLETLDFGVYAVTHKFGEQFDRTHQFYRCHAIFMSCVFMPPSNINKPDAITVGLCPDRRGDSDLELVRDLEDVKKITELWGSQSHWAIQDNINVENCPRCTCQPHNQIFEQVIEKDLMTYRFI